MAEKYAGAMIGGTVKDAAPQSATDEINYRLNTIHERMTLSTDRMQRILDRAFGASPAVADPVAPREVPAGAIGGISQRLRDIEQVSEAQLDLLGRLDKIV